eukprot:CCRYP_004311-RB/>CCRYP_004311-RB protein AED:0.26 eAED:0.22 QI:0/-1/0/1/-1/1/1/0/535
MHAVCGYSVKSTWLKAVQAGYFIWWPLFNVRNIQKYFPKTVETPKGHLNKSRKNVRSTKQKPILLELFQSPQLKGRKLRDVYTHVYDTRDTIFSDQTGKFPHRSLSGNYYLIVMVDIDSSTILVEPIKNRTDTELTRAYSSLIVRLHRSGIFPRKHVLDNEISNAMKTLITDTYKMTYALVPPGCHHRNAAEVAIRNFKSHFLSILARVANDFPMKLWDKLLPQAEITINLLQQSNATSMISAYTHLNGPFDYNKMPLALMGCKDQVHEKSDTCGTWAFHSIDGWYLGTSPEHYRTHKCHIKSTNSDCLSNTVVFQHKTITHPSLTPTDKLMQAVAACAAALKGITAPTQDITDLKALLDITAATSPTPTEAHTTKGVPRVRSLSNPPSLPRVPPTNDPAPSRVTRSTTNQHPIAPVAISMPRLATKLKRGKPPKPSMVPDLAPACNTRSHTTAKAKVHAAPVTNTRSQRILRIPKPIPVLSKRIKRVDTEVHWALAVMNHDTSKLLGILYYGRIWSLSTNGRKTNCLYNILNRS